MNKKSGILVALGLLLLVAAAVLTGYNIRSGSNAAKASAEVLAEMASRLSKQESAVPDYILDPNMEMPTFRIDGADYIGVVLIPALDAELPVADEWSYVQLRVSPCRYAGSAYTDSLIVCGHNYSSHFGNLKYLELGDSVIFTDADGNVFNYEVAQVETLQPTAVEEMKSEEWDLTLFTCTIGGQSRVTVRCNRIELKQDRL